MYCIYKLYRKSEPYKTRYIGQTKNSIERRLTQHKSSARKSIVNGKSSHLYKWINKYKDEIIIKELERVQTKTEVDEREIQLIAEYKKKGYRLVNTTEGGNGAKGLSYTKNGKAKRVIQYSLEGDIIKVHSCMRKAQDDTGIKAALISGCITLKRVLSAGSYMWRMYSRNYLKKITPYDEEKEKGKTVGANKKSKAVYQYAMTGELMKEWSSLRALDRDSDMKRQGVKYGLNEKAPAYGYQWSRLHMENIGAYAKKESTYRGRKVVIQYDKSMNKIKEWEQGVYEIVKSTSYKENAIRCSLIGKYRTAYGYIWKYKE